MRAVNDMNPHTSTAATDATPPGQRKPKYPRSWWLGILRFLLIISGLPTGPLYVWEFYQASVHHTLHTLDRDLRTVHSIALVVLLTIGGIWATRDLVREWKAEDRQRKAKREAERSVPYAVGAEQKFRADLARARERGDRRAEGIALGKIGFWLKEQERFAEAEACLTQSLELVRAANDRFHEEHALNYLGQCAFEHGNLDEAESLFRQSLAVALKLNREDLPYSHPRDESVLNEIADSYAILGQFLAEQRNRPLAARQMFAEAESRYRDVARGYEMAARARWPWSPRRATEKHLRRNALACARDMHDLQRKYGANGGEGMPL